MEVTMVDKRYLYKYHKTEELTIEDIVTGFIDSLYQLYSEGAQLEVEYGSVGVSKMYYASPSNIRWSLNLKDFQPFNQLELKTCEEEAVNDY